TPEIPLEQGGYVQVSIRNLDIENPWDPSTTTLEMNPMIGNVQVGSISSYAASLFLQVDVLAAAGDVDVLMKSGPMTSTVDYPAPKAVKIAARAPTAITGAMPGSGMVMKYSDTGLFSY